MNPDQHTPLEHPDTPLNLPPQGSSVPNAQSPLAAPQGEALPPVATPTQSMPTYDAARVASDAPKKTYHPKRFMIALGAFVAVSILSVAAMLAFALLPTTSHKESSTKDESTPEATVTTVSAKKAITHVKEHFKGKEAAKSPVIRPVLSTGNQFYTVVPDTAPLVSAAGEVAPSSADTQLQAIIHSLKDDEFTQQVVSDGASGNYLATFTKPETYCQVAVTKPTDTKANQWFEVRCLDMATYVDYAAAQKPLVSLYAPLSATSVQYGFVGKPVVTPSKTANYNTVQLEVSSVIDDRMTSNGTYALFYQTPDGLWHYFRDRDMSVAFDCSVYATDDLKSAYAGATCRNVAKNTTTIVEAPKKKS